MLTYKIKKAPRLLRLLILFLIAFCSACTASVKDNASTDKNEASKTIYLINHGWHVGIVFRRNDITDNWLPITKHFPTAKHLEVGWGDMDYYQTPNPHLGISLKALLLPSSSVLHVVGFNTPVTHYFKNSEIIRIELPAAGFYQLSQALSASFALDDKGDIHSIGRGLYGDSQFYLSNESYHLFNTCNVWVARKLQAAGLNISPALTIRANRLMSRAKEFGIIIQTETLQISRD